ncbi:MAG: S1 RNA-binding domain-containing protein [Clostridia bacterium]|nr:S1 RNA-binding domain-containing protein [Clostridia bacterium]
MPYSIGESVKGTVSGVTEYGAFVRLEDGSSGMIHISKLSRDFVSDIHSVIKKGDAVTATVISDNGGKLALSLVGERPVKPDRNLTFGKRQEKTDFESMLSSFKTASEEKLSMINRRDKKRR